MGEPIRRYVEERHEYGEADGGRPAPGVMQVFYESGVPVMVDFLCPCGCGRTCPIHLVLPGEAHKGRRWAYSPGPKLTPSIRFNSGCKSHFNVEDGGEVKMHAD